MAQTCFSEEFREWLDKTNKIHNYNTEKIAMLYHNEQLKLCEVSKSLPIGDVEILLIALEHIGKWGDEEEERWDDQGDCAMDAIVQYRYSIK